MPPLCLATIYAYASVLAVLKDAPALLVVWLAFYVAYVLLVWVHETGHLLVGLACGFRVKEYRVSCIRWRKGWALDWRGSSFLSGQVNTQFTSPDDRLRARLFLFVAAGPLANLMFAATLYPIAVHQSTLGGIAKYLFLGSTLLAVASLIPMKFRKLKSDGLQLFSTVFDRKGFEALRFHVRCQEAAPVLQRLRDQGDWAGMKDITERLLALSSDVRAKEEVVNTLSKILLFADGQLAEAAVGAK